jgi:protease IV
MRRLVLLLCVISLLSLPMLAVQAADPVKADPAKANPAKADPAKATPAKTEPAKAEPVKADPAKANPVKAEPAKAEPAKTEPTSTKPQKAHHHHAKKDNDKDKVKAKDKAKPKDEAKADKGKEAPAAKAPTKSFSLSVSVKVQTGSQAAKPAEKSTKKPTVVLFTINGQYPEGTSAPELFGEMHPSLSSLIQRMDAAAADKNVAAVWLKIENPMIGRGKIHELRAAIARLRKANKPVYAEITLAGAPQYLVASACGQIVMPPSGILIVPGVRAEVTFYKGLLDKIGLQFEALQMGKYKGAAEPLTRNAMSKPLRESFDALVDDIYDDLVATICADRKMQDYKVKTLLDQGLFTATAAKKAGLVDELLYADELQESIKKTLKADAVEIVTNYKKKRVDTDFSGMSGMMKMLEIVMGGKKSEAASSKQKIAVVYAVGPIMEGKSQHGAFGDSVLGSTTIVTALKKAADDAKVSAIVLRIDSPGGSAVASDLIWRETVRIGAKKPVIASMSDVAGSGGYYIAMGAKKIIAAPGTLTGSIGVIGGKMVIRGLFDKLGMNIEVISRGANSGSLSSATPFTPEERRAMTEVMEETYRQFVSKAATGRKMPYEKLDEMAQGRLYTGRMAKKLGLIDELGTLDDAVAAAKTAAGLKPDADVDLMILPEPKSIFEQLFGDPSASTDMESMLPEGFNIFRQTKVLRQLLSERILMWMPYGVEVK